MEELGQRFPRLEVRVAGRAMTGLGTTEIHRAHRWATVGENDELSVEACWFLSANFYYVFLFLVKISRIHCKINN